MAEISWRYCADCGRTHPNTTAGCSYTATNYPSPRQAVQPFACPVCHGYKTVSKPAWVGGDQSQWASGGTDLHPCPACNATGIVWGPPA